jgi:hypothetical protein
MGGYLAIYLDNMCVHIATRSIALWGSPFNYVNWISLLPAVYVDICTNMGKLDLSTLNPDHPAVQLVVGLLLGDGCFDSGGATGNPRIKLDCGYNLHGLACIVVLLYVFTKVGLHRTGCFTMARDIGRGVANGGLERVYYSLVMNSARHSFFKLLIGTFVVKQGRKWIKVMPDNIQDYLGPIALAIWFLGDGELVKGNRLNFCSQGFDEATNHKLSQAINKRYGIQTTVWKERNLNVPITKGIVYNYYITIPPVDVPVFVNLVKPFLPISVYYKIPVNLR